ncbi:CAPRIN2 [Branchiostoma lanceolatum]|uniref:CAPRIN2 protein n=1 Tax=Branchiostoma lanceolatum TaxID=7740 RepID=A0A8J9VAJ4_BRALA|nr:CAPRIN2 [Branchiostoma lanceolatum]
MKFQAGSLCVLVAVALVGVLPSARCGVLQKHRSDTLYYDDGNRIVEFKIREEANPVYLPEADESTLSPAETTPADPTTVKTTTAATPPTTTATTTTTTQQANATTTSAATTTVQPPAIVTTTAQPSNATTTAQPPANATTTAQPSANATTTAQPPAATTTAAQQTTTASQPQPPPVPPKPAARVAFSVARLSSFGPSRRDEILPYDHMYSNAGGAFCMHTNTFTAPCAGTYQFSWSGQKRSEFKMYLGLYKNGEEMAGVYADDIDPARFPNLNPQTASNTVILHLYEKDEVTVVIAEGAQTFSNDIGKYTSFSGFLLFQDDPEA